MKKLKKAFFVREFTRIFAIGLVHSVDQTAMVRQMAKGAGIRARMLRTRKAVHNRQRRSLRARIGWQRRKHGGRLTATEIDLQTQLRQIPNR